MQANNSKTIWERFVTWWQPYNESMQEDIFQSKYEFPENEYGNCHWFDENDSMSCLRDVKIYLIETFNDGAVVRYCEMHAHEVIMERTSEWHPSEAELHEMDRKNFVKFFRNWRYGYIQDHEIIEFNDFDGYVLWNREELLEIFSILELYVMTNDESATKFDNLIAQYKKLGDVIKEIL